MDPIAFRIFGMEIRWYGILIALGIISAIALVNFNCKRKKMNFDNFLDMFLIVLPIGVLGARLYYVIFQFSYYKSHLNEIINIRQGGLAIHGGLIFGIITAFIYTRIKRLDFRLYADVAAPSIILAQAIGRWGNFFNGEAHGDIVTYGFISKFPSFIQKGMNIDGAYYNPTFLYESLWDITICGVLLYILYKSSEKTKGIVIASYMILYSIGRFFIEGLRTDSLQIIGLRTAQIVSLASIIVGVIIILSIKNKKIYKLNDKSSNV